MNFNIIGVCSDWGCPNKGTKDAFNHILEEEKTSYLKKEKNTSIIPNSDYICNLKNEYHLNNPQKVISVCNSLNKEVYNTIKSGDFPFIIGGDHSLGLGSVSAFADFFGKDDFAVVWIDAHTDIHRQDTSDSHNIHGMPLGISTHTDSSSANLAQEITQTPLPWALSENIFIIGARSIDVEEEKIIKHNGVNVYKMDDIKKIGLEKIIKQVIKKIGSKKVLLSFDVDALDAKGFKATGLPVENGFCCDEVILTAKALINETDVRYFDCVEYSPSHDKTSNSARNNGYEQVAKIINSCYAAIKNKYMIK